MIKESVRPVTLRLSPATEWFALALILVKVFCASQCVRSFGWRLAGRSYMLEYQTPVPLALVVWYLVVVASNTA